MTVRLFVFTTLNTWAGDMLHMLPSVTGPQWGTRRYMNMDHLTKFEDDQSELIVG